MARDRQLFSGGSVDTVWAGVVRPWFEQARREAWQSEKPWVLLAPSRIHAARWKTLAIQECGGVLGVRFWTLGQARDFLLSHMDRPPVIGVREHLHLALALAAQAQGDDPTCRAIARDPARLLRSLDQLAAAGLDARALDLPAAQTIAKAFAEQVRKAGWLTVQQADWALAESPRPCIASLLMAGFDAAYWEQWPLLSALVLSADSARVVLPRPRLKGERLDTLWTGTWENAFGAAQAIDEASGPTPPFASLAERMENPDAQARKAADDAPVARVLIGRTVEQQADAVALQAIQCLSSGRPERVGIVCPGPGPLSREISARLAARGIAHYDALGHTVAPDVANLRWQAWLALHDTPCARRLRALPGWTPQGISIEDFDRAVERAFTSAMVDDLPVLAAWLEQSGDEIRTACAAALKAVVLLPARASLGELIDTTRTSLADLGWPDMAAELEPQFAAVAHWREETLPRGLYLAWLSTLVTVSERDRDKAATNPHAPVQIVSYAQAENLDWSHLILTGLNDGQWPPSFEQPGLLPEERIDELNGGLIAQGSQGEGHDVVRPGRSLLLGPQERRTLARRQFYNLVESASVSLSLSASLEPAEDSNRVIPASDYLAHLHFIATGKALDEDGMLRAQRRTADWLTASSPVRPEAPAAQPVPVEQSRIAYEARRGEATFGPYEFAPDRPPEQPITLACKEWEGAISDPAGTWIAAVLGVSPADDALESDPLALARGTWAHQWLNRAMGDTDGSKLIARPDGKEMLRRLDKSAESLRARAGRAFGAAGRKLPDWWESRWQEARWTAHRLAERVASIPDWPWVAPEWKLPGTMDIDCGGGNKLRVRGRIDLVLGKREEFAKSDVLWLIDYKTGADKPLSARNLAGRLATGGGLQVCLYALALRALGADDVAVTLLTPDSAAEPQISIGDLAGMESFWRGLCRMQDMGVFGMRGELRPEFGVGPALPMATLYVPGDLLELKWGLTHPDLAGGDE